MTALLRFNRAVDQDEAIVAWFDTLPRDLGEMARHWFGVMRRSGADVRELMHDGLATVCVDDAPFAYVGAFTAHVNVGFFHGAALPDPNGMMLGSGKRMRHVKLVPGAAVDASSIAALIAAAHRDIVERLGA